MFRETDSSRITFSRHGSIGSFLFALLFFTTVYAHAVAPGNNRPFRVVDRKGAFVGFTITENLVAREIDGIWVTFYVHTGLGVFDSGAIYVYFTTPDCSGTRYVSHYSTFAEGTRVGPLLYFPSDSQVLEPRSTRVEFGSGDVGQCRAVGGLSGVFGVAQTVNVDSFDLELPFRAVQ